MTTPVLAQPQRKFLECAHLLFYLGKLLCCGWFCWRDVYWLGFLCRQGRKGNGLSSIGLLLLIHDGFCRQTVR
jgi:hypothetical protein